MRLAGFPELAVRAFGPVIADYGFVHVATHVWCVSFESNAVRLDVVHDRRGGEIEIWLGLKRSTPMETIGLGWLLRAAGSPEADRVNGYASLTAVPDVLDYLASVVRHDAGRALAGDEAIFASAFQLRTEASVAAHLERELRLAASASEIAWRQKDYAGVIAALTPIEAHLSPAQSARLLYCRKQFAA